MPFSHLLIKDLLSSFDAYGDKFTLKERLNHSS